MEGILYFWICVLLIAVVICIATITIKLCTSKKGNLVTKIKIGNISAELNSESTIANAYLSYYAYAQSYFEAVFKGNKEKIGLASYLYMNMYPVTMSRLADIVAMVNAESVTEEDLKNLNDALKNKVIIKTKEE